MELRTFVVAACLAGVPAHLLAQERVAQGRERRGLDFSPAGVWRARSRAVARERASLLARGDVRSLNAAVGARAPQASAQAAVSGTLRVPLVLFRFRDSDLGALRDTSQYDQLMFGSSAPAGRPYSLRTYYQELSRNLLSIAGSAYGWLQLDSDEVAYTGTPGTCDGPYGNCNGVGSLDAFLRMQRGLREALAKLDATVDFGQFDNDGPDGIPNSGDDDGYVDLVSFVHPSQDGACVSPANNHIWSHRSMLLDTAGGKVVERDYVTNDLAARGGMIRIRDYIVESGVGGATGCDSSQIMPIGAVAHELGHGLDLPDLYSTTDGRPGIGQWGLMGAGNWATPNSPARMEAWSLAELGWVTVQPLTASGTFTLGPAPSSDTTFVVNPLGANPRGEYYLIENRQRMAADTAMIRVHCETSGDPPACGGGLLVLHIDWQAVVGGRAGNTVNGMWPDWGVRVVEADGHDDLGAGWNRGDAGDVFPGVTHDTVLSGHTWPALLKNADGAPAGFTIDDIHTAAPDGPISLRVTFDAALALISAPALPTGLLGEPYADTLWATGGDATYAWELGKGSPPAGISLGSDGVLSGTPRSCGQATFEARVTSGAQSLTRQFSVAAIPPRLDTAQVVDQLLEGTGALSNDEVHCLDQLGNGNGRFDAGDLRAWLTATAALRTAKLARAASSPVHRR